MSKLLRKIKKAFYPYYWAHLRRVESLTHGLPPYSEILLEEKRVSLALADAERVGKPDDIAFIKGKLDIISWLKRYGNPEA
jgi:hypothetical protein